MDDITLISVPYTVIENPPLGISVIKGALQSQGLTCTTMDLGMELYLHCKKDRRFFDSVQEYLYSNITDRQEIIATVQNFVDHWANELVERKSRWIGISVFSYYAHHASLLLCHKIKRLNPGQKIVLGGAGCAVKIQNNLWDQFEITGMEKMMAYGELLKKRSLADELILGDGEQALLDLLRNDRVADGFHMVRYRDEERSHAYANYDDYDLSLYQGQLNRGRAQLPIFSSKGCVRNCDFCDVNVIQNRFRFRTGENIVKEMIHLADRYGIRDFLFCDSLVNGSLKSLREWVTALAQYNKDNPARRITWSAAGWICRPIGQIPEDFYPILAQSGLQSVTIGIESGSNHVLKAMNKKTNVEALFYEAEQLKKNDIKFIGQLIVGHWAERWQDFLDTAVMVYKLSRYSKTGHLVALSPGATFEIHEDTPADRDTDINKLIKSQANVWWTPLNPALTGKERYFRRLLLEKLLNTLNVAQMAPAMIAGLRSIIEKSLPEMQRFYTKVLDQHGDMPEQGAEYYFDNFEDFLSLVIDRANDAGTVDIDLELECSVTNDNPPKIEITINNKILFSGSLQEGIHRITLDNVALDDTNAIELRFSNKLPGDTLVDNQGNIVKDKFVEIKKFSINGLDLRQDQEFFFGQLQYWEADTPTRVRPGFWLNHSHLRLQFDKPFDLWYARKSTNFSKFDGFLITEKTPANARTITDLDSHRQQCVDMLKTLRH